MTKGDKKENFFHSTESETPRQRQREEVSLEAEVFGKDYLSTFMYKKTQRLTAALFLVTDLIGEKEDIRVRLRKKGLELLSCMLSLTTGISDRNVNSSYESAINLIFEIRSLLEISYISGFVSEMNFTVLSGEYSELVGFLRNKKGRGLGERFLLDKNFFNVVEWSEDSGRRAPSSVDKGQKDKRTNEKRQVKSSTSSLRDIQGVKDTSKRHKDSSVDREDISSKKTSSADLSERKSIILDLVKKKGRVNVKDVSEVIIDCSEKTLQRELASMVRGGFIEKKGDKRWSYYVLPE